MIGAPDLDRLALGGQQLADRAGERRGQLDERLGGLDLDDHVVDGDGVTGGDAPRHDLGLGEAFADVGEDEGLSAHGFSLCCRATREPSPDCRDRG